jgi:hypothetical protein
MAVLALSLYHLGNRDESFQQFHILLSVLKLYLQMKVSIQMNIKKSIDATSLGPVDNNAKIDNFNLLQNEIITCTKKLLF